MSPTTRDRRSGDEALERKPSMNQLRASKPLKGFHLAEGLLPITVNDPHSKVEEPDRLSRVSPPIIMNTTQSLDGRGCKRV